MSQTPNDDPVPQLRPLTAGPEELRYLLEHVRKYAERWESFAGVLYDDVRRGLNELNTKTALKPLAWNDSPGHARESVVFKYLSTDELQCFSRWRRVVEQMQDLSKIAKEGVLDDPEMLDRCLRGHNLQEAPADKRRYFASLLISIHTNWKVLSVTDPIVKIVWNLEQRIVDRLESLSHSDRASLRERFEKQVLPASVDKSQPVTPGELNGKSDDVEAAGKAVGRPADDLQKDWLNQAQTARGLGLQRWEINRFVKDGTLKTNGKSGRECRIDPASILAYCKSKRLTWNDDEK